jgi:hypothetical protein
VTFSRLRWVSSSVLVLAATVAPPGIAAQDAAMPLQLFEGNEYERRVFTPDGVAEGVQRITIGTITEVGDELEIPVTSHGFDEAGQPSDSVHTTIRCRPEDAGMVMNILALVQQEGRDIRLRLRGGAVLYPDTAAAGPLPDVTLEASVEEGVVGFLGGRSQIVLNERTVTLEPEGEVSSAAGSYEIASRIELKFYVLGIRVRSKRYDARETISPERGLLRLELTSEGGGVAVLTRVTSAEG